MKTHLTKRILALLLTLAMVLSLLPMAFAEEDAPKSNDLVILYTNDVHCGVDQSDSSIGVAGLAKVKKDLEATHENVALVDNGDFVQGELIGTVSKGEYLVQIMNYLGYDYGTFGNHEFDYTMPQLKTLVDMADMTYLSCNFQYIGPGEDPNAVDVDGYKIVDYDGLKVGYVGITTPESLVKSTPTYFQDENGEWIYTFCNGGDGQELYDAVQAAVDAARAEGAQVVVALAHLGIDEQSSPWMSTEVIANTTGIDVVLDGHSHSTIARQEVANKNGETVLLSSTGTKLANIGKLTVTPEGAVDTELITRADVDGVDPDTQDYLEQIEAEFEELKQTVVAHTDYDLLTTNPETNARMVRMRETNLGDVCADAYRTILDADIAFVNGGGVRANIPAGDITYEQIIKVHPYSNMACKVKTTGQQILDALEMASRSVTVDENGNLSGENGGFLQVAGLKYTINIGIPSSVVVDESKMFVEVAGDRRVQNVKVLQADGSYAPIDPNGEYTLASHNYMLKQSGDGINMFKNDELLLDEVKVDNQVLIEYMSSEEFAAHDYSNWEGEGRIKIINVEPTLTGKTVILHTNDTHGALLGFAQVAEVKALYEAMGATVILADAGDFSQGTTYVSTNKGAAAVTMMNAAGYDFVTLGNHEFDFGYAQLMQNLDSAEFTALCADVFKKGTEESILPAYAIKEVNGLKIGFFGMETPETQTKVNPGLITEIEFGTNENGKFVSSAKAAVAALQAEGADLIIGLVHLGVDDESEPYRSFELYSQLEGVDFLIDGHSHTVMTEGPDGEPIQSTGTKASKTALMNVGCIVIDNETKTIEDNYLIPLGEEAPVDEEIAAIAQEIMDAVDEEYGAVFAQSAVELNGDKAPGNRNMETNLGDLITDALLWSVMKDMDAETLGVPAENVVAITNGGGIRAWIHKGDVTMNDVNTVLPFGNTVAVVYVTGAELLEALEASTAFAPGAVGGFPQISGMKINIDVTKEFDEGELYPDSTYHKPNSIRRVSIDNVNGKKFDPKATYAVVTNNFCAAGGDTYYVFKNASSQFDTGIPMDEALMEFIKDPTFLNGYISEYYAEPQGRITQDFRFEDVQSPNRYYFEPVYWAYNHDPQITAGMTETLFGPNEIATRAQVMTFLWKAYGAEKPSSNVNPFIDDVKIGAYYYDAVLWAVERGITSGVSATAFGSKLTCTRAEVITFLWIAAGRPEVKRTVNPFIDVRPGAYYYNAVLWAVENNITNGTSENTFSPNDPCTRAQIVTFLYCAMAKESSSRIKVFETTDVHGYLLDASSLNESTFQYRLAYLAKIFNNARESEEYEDVLLLDGGDIYQGTPVSNLLQGNAIRAALDVMGYDAVALGNHEFDWDVTNNADAEGTIPAYDIGEFSGDPDIPILAYNLYYADSGERVNFTQDYTIVEKAGFRIAIIGYIPNYRGDIMAARINPYTIDEDLTKLAAKVKEVNRAEKPDATIVLAHESPRGIANAMDPAEVDLVLGGHSHSGNAGVASNGIPYLQGNCQAKGYASADLILTRNGVAGPVTVSVENPLYTDTTGSANRPNLYDTPENADKLDPQILAISHAAWEAVKGDMEEVLGYVDVDVDKTKVSDNGATVAGNWISGLMLRGTADLQPVAAFYNSGGIRTTFKIPEGETTRNITTADIYTINPFDNCWLVFELTGAEIAQQLLNGFINGNFGDQMSGLTFTYWQEGSGKNAVRGIVSITLDDGTEIDPTDTETTYRVCTSNYSATLDGSVFLGKEPLVPMADAPVDNVTIIELLRAEGQANNGYLAVDTGVRGTRVEKPAEPVEFEFLVTSDLHGQIYATDYTAPYEKSGTYSRGLTRVASYIKEQKAAYGDNVYVVDMGDTFQGAPLTYYYAFNKPEEKDPAILAFRTIGYDMWVVGNHEFNYGLEILNRQMAYAVSEGDENEKQLTISLANYLDAATNSDETKDWATWKGYAPYVIKDFDGYKVAIIGFGNPNIPKWDVPANWEGIYFANIIDTYKHYEAEMLEQADMIVVVAHSGIDSDPGSDFIKELVEETNSIAFAFSGHEHRNAITTVNNADGKGISILSPYTKARRIAQVKVTVDGDNVTIVPELQNMENYPIDEDLATLLEPYEIETWEGYMLQPIGTALGDYPAANLGTAPSAFMDLINTVQTWGAYDRGGVNTPDNDKDDEPAMLSISAPLTSGSNANLISEGPIVLGDMFGLYRFENWFYQITMTGEEVHQWLEFAATKVRIDGEGKPYVTNSDLTYYDVIMGDGFHYDIDVSLPEGERVINMRYKGQPVEADQEFTVVVNNYRYNGGGNYVKWLNDHGCEFTANDPDRIIYSTQFDMIQGEDEGQARALLVSYIKDQTAKNGGITPFITSDWTVQNGYVAPDDGSIETSFPSTSNSDIEKYGNIYTSLNAADFFDAGYTWGDVVTVSFLEQSLELPVVPTYSYVDQGTAAVIVSKNGETGAPVGRVKMAINMGNFADFYGLATKSTVDGSVVWTPCEGVEFPVPVVIEMGEQGGYLSELILHDINRTNNREDYPDLSDEEFANFRKITTTGMGDHLYRGSSPINPEIGRNAYADAALEAAGATVIMNLANNQTEAEGYEGYADTYYADQNIIFLNLGVDFQEADFQAGLANGLKFFAQNEGVYYVHCTEGKDRAGFVSALLECLMGATCDEVVADYLKTYTNYYTVVDGQQQALSQETLDAIANSNIIKSLQTAFGVTDLKTADLAAEAEEYITAIGLNAEELAALKANLAN